MNSQAITTHSFDRAIADMTRCVSRWAHGYVSIRLTLIGVRDQDTWKIASGQIVARMGQLPTPRRIIEAPGVVAFQADIDGGMDALLELLSQVRNGQLSVGGRTFVFPIENDLSAHFEYLNPQGLRDGRRLTTLRIYGAQRGGFYDRTKLDWELKAASPPFDGIWDLLGEVGLAVPDGDRCNIEVVLLNVVEVLSSSHVNGNQAVLDVMMSLNLTLTSMRFGYKVFQHRTLVRRDSCSGSDFAWTEHEGVNKGHIDLDVPTGSVVQTFLSYDGEAQQQYWMVDPSSLPNARKAAYALFDRDLEVLRDYLWENSQPRKNPQRDFEDGVATLLFVLGFAPVNMGGIQRLQDTPDCLCCTPSGDYAIVECTTGHPDRDDKLSKLFTRAQGLRGTLDRSGLQERRLLPVLVTAMSRPEIPQSELDKAAQMKIVVVCREDLESALQRADFGESADRIFADGVVRLNAYLQLPLQNGFA